MYLVDKNVWLEGLLEETNIDEVRQFFLAIPADMLVITDFSLHSICVILLRQRKPDLLTMFLEDIMIQNKIKVIRIRVSQLIEVVATKQTHNLDFDDAYQFTAATLNKLTLVSFDTDFTHRKLGCKTPAQILEERGSGST